MASTRSRWLRRIALCAFAMLSCLLLGGYVWLGLTKGGAAGKPEQGSATDAATSGVELGPETKAEMDKAIEGLDLSSLEDVVDAAGENEASTEELDLSVEDAAEEVLGRYLEESDVALARAGWVDLLGRCWGCVAVGPGWADVCLVSGDDSSSKVQTLRMEADEWRRAYASS